MPNLDTVCCETISGLFLPWTEEYCEALGTCEGSSYHKTECGCVGTGESDWISAGYQWYSDYLWTPYSLPQICEENENLEGEHYDWKYTNLDPHADKYLIVLLKRESGTVITTLLLSEPRRASNIPGWNPSIATLSPPSQEDKYSRTLLNKTTKFHVKHL